jgi:hypothetical protein
MQGDYQLAKVGKMVLGAGCWVLGEFNLVL